MRISVTLPDPLEKTARELAEQHGVTLEEFVVATLAEKIRALSTDDFFRQRRAGASFHGFGKHLDNVPDVPPAPGHEMPERRSDRSG